MFLLRGSAAAEAEYHLGDAADLRVEIGATTRVVTVTLEDRDPAEPRPADLFDALTTRATSHEVFDDRPIAAETVEQLSGSIREGGVTLRLVDDPGTKGALSELQAEADRLQLDDPAYRKELGHWIGSGALGSSWLAARIGQTVVTHLDIGDREAAKNSKLVQSAPVVAILTTDSDDPTARVRTGQAFERIALLASSDGVSVHPMSQTLERPELRTRLAELLDSSEKPQHLFRLGYTEQSPDHTPRWPLETFLASE